VLARIKTLWKRRTLMTIIRFVVTSCLLWYVISKINIQESIEILVNANAIYLLAVLGVAISINVIYSRMWKIVLAAQGIDIPLLRLLALYYVGLFFNNFMPSSFGGDIMKIYQLSRYTKKGFDSSMSVLVTRFISLYALLLIATIALMWSGWNIGFLDAIVLAATSFLSIIGVLIFFGTRLLGPMDQILARSGNGRLRAILEQVYGSMCLLKHHKVAIIIAIIHASICHILIIFAYYLLSLSLEFSIPLYYFFLFIPLIRLLVMMPISINGFGLREGAFVALFAQVGLSTSAAVSLSLIGRFMGILISLIGGVYYLFGSGAEASYAIAEKD